MPVPLAKTGSIETRYSIVILFAICYVNAIFTGWNVTNAVLVNQLEIKYANPVIEAEASLVTSLYSTLSSVMLLFAVPLLTYVGVRTLGVPSTLVIGVATALSPFNSDIMWWLATYSIPSGLCCAFIYASFSIIIPQYFDVHLGRMFGLMCFCSGMTSFLVPIMWNSLAPLGFQTSMYVFGAIMASSSLAYLLLKVPHNSFNATASNGDVVQDFVVVNDADIRKVRVPEAGDSGWSSREEESQPLLASVVAVTSPTMSERLKRIFQVEILRNRNFIFMTIGISICNMTLFVPVTHVPAYFELYYPGRDSDLLISALGIGLAVSKLICGSSIDYLPLKVSYYILQVGLVGCAITSILLSYVIMTHQNYLWVIACMVVYGIFEAPTFSMTFPIIRSFLDKDLSAMANVYQNTFGGLLGMIGPPAAGLLFDMSKSYHLCYLASSIPMLIGASVMFISVQI